MATPQEWADFLLKLGLKTTKQHIKELIERKRMSGDEIWNYFIEPYSLLKEAAHENRFYKAEDVDWYLSEVSYINMRGTYPRRSHGRSLIVPRIVSVDEIKARKEKQNPVNEPKQAQIVIPDNLVGKQIVHNTFGPGKIIDQTSSRNIVVAFETVGKKLLNYQVCIENELIIFP